MSSERFDHLKNILKPLITKQSTNLRDAIFTGEKLSLTLRFLASGESEQSLSFAYRLEKSTVSNIKETCYGKLTPIYLTTPSSEENWLKITSGSKHIRTKCPADTGAKFHNHKRFFSLVLLTASDARCCFTLTDIGKYGSNNYSGVLKISELSNLNLKQLIYLNQELLICSFDPLLYFLIGDETFSLKTWLIRPYPGTLPEEQRVYNLRQSRSRLL